MQRIFLFFAAVAILALTGCIGESTGTIPAVADFDAVRYMGTWYEIARLPHLFERNLDFVRAEYTLTETGIIEVRNSGSRDGNVKSIEGIAKLERPGELSVMFFWPFRSAYRIIYLEEDYSATIVTGSTKNYLWILARTPQLPPEKLREYLDRIASWGFDSGQLEFPQQCQPVTVL